MNENMDLLDESALFMHIHSLFNYNFIYFLMANTFLAHKNPKELIFRFMENTSFLVKEDLCNNFFIKNQGQETINIITDNVNKIKEDFIKFFYQMVEQNEKRSGGKNGN